MNDDESSNVEQVEQWRAARRELEEKLIEKWGRVGLNMVAAVIPIVGLVWGIMLGLREDGQERLQGLRYFGWCVLGCIVWVVVWRIWGADISTFMFKSFTEKMEQAMRGLR